MCLYRRLQRYLLPATILALLLFLSSFWLPQVGMHDCGKSWHPCLNLNFYLPTAEEPVVPGAGRAPIGVHVWDRGAGLGSIPPLQVCPGQQFQVWRLMSHLTASMATHPDDVLLEPYLYSWDELIKFMESLGSLVNFFSQKVKEKIVVIRELAAQLEIMKKGKQSSVEEDGRLQTHFYGLQSPEAYRSVRSMVESELQMHMVNFNVRTRSGSRNLLRLHRSLLWIILLLQGLGEGPDAQGVYRTPGELCRDAYSVALAPHHPWLIRSAAEMVFLALPERKVFLDIVCVKNEEDVEPVLKVVINTMKEVHARTQRILEQHNMMELP
ncbi:hypothetical protein UPYG_G00240920 [Umbra pygmaea]|uniref:Glycolipid transfer protein domain-containing protein n=1 Tax=Umbra pygmaea TaxID=75934 RepID=A0ABD0WK44_UMBPY